MKIIGFIASLQKEGNTAWIVNKIRTAYPLSNDWKMPKIWHIWDGDANLNQLTSFNWLTNYFN
jgi:hypothetical protein